MYQNCLQHAEYNNEYKKVYIENNFKNAQLPVVQDGLSINFFYLCLTKKMNFILVLYSIIIVLL